MRVGRRSARPVSSDARLVRRRWRAPRPAPAGQVTVLMALFITALLGAAALSVDLGYAYVQHRRMQNGVALRHAHQLPLPGVHGGRLACAVWLCHGNLLLSLSAPHERRVSEHSRVVRARPVHAPRPLSREHGGPPLAPGGRTRRRVHARASVADGRLHREATPRSVGAARRQGSPRSRRQGSPRRDHSL